MSGEPKTESGTLFRRVPVILRSWDGPNSRIGVEVDLDQMPWGPFDALGQRLGLLLPVHSDFSHGSSASESQVERALRHVEHAADRCGEFARLTNGDQELWLRSQQTWEWIRRYLTSLWVEREVEGGSPGPTSETTTESVAVEDHGPMALSMPGAASTLRVAARALRATPLTTWRETIGSMDPDAPTREEAVQTLLGVAKVLNARLSQEEAGPGGFTGGEGAESNEPREGGSGGAEVNEDPDQLSFEYAQGYDEGYQMGRRVGLALGSRLGDRAGKGRPESP